MVPGSGRSPGKRDRLPTAVFMGFPGGSDHKESSCDAGDPDLIPGSERSAAEGNGYPLQYSALENPHRQRSLAGYSSWAWEESDMTERLSTHMCSSTRVRFIHEGFRVGICVAFTLCHMRGASRGLLETFTRVPGVWGLVFDSYLQV